MIIGDAGALGQAIYGSVQVKAQLTRLTAQAGSGHVSDSLAGLGAAAQVPLSLSPQIAGLAAEQGAIGSVTGRLDLSQTALTQISAIGSSLRAQLASLNDVTPAQVDNVAQAAKSGLQQVASLLNTWDGSVYVFAGTDSAHPPVPGAATITSSAFYQQIGAAVAGLAANGAASVTAATLAVASSNAANVSPFSGPPGQAPTIVLRGGAPVPVGVLANANTLAVSGGASTTGSFMRDILRSLATVANLTSAQAGLPGFSALVQDTGTSLGGAITALGTEQGSLGNIQSALGLQATEAADTSAALTRQVSAVTDVDMAKTLADLSQVQTQLTASYKLISQTTDLSLVKYL